MYFGFVFFRKGFVFTCRSKTVCEYADILESHTLLILEQIKVMISAEHEKEVQICDRYSLKICHTPPKPYVIVSFPDGI